MPIYYLKPNPYSFDERKLPNGKYRYKGNHANVSYCIESQNRKTEQQIFNFLKSRPIEYLINNENNIIILN